MFCKETKKGNLPGRAGRHDKRMGGRAKERKGGRVGKGAREKAAMGSIKEDGVGIH